MLSSCLSFVATLAVSNSSAAANGVPQLFRRLAPGARG